MIRILIFMGMVVLAACSVKPKDNAMSGEKTDSLLIYSLKNQGLEMMVTNFGGRIISLNVPDRSGTPGNVVLGYDSLSQYPKGNPYFGAMIGRYGNRIGKAQFTLDGKTYQLAANNGPNALHGGPKGFHNVYWTMVETTTPDGPALEMYYVARDGEEGYPGNLKVKVTYTLSNEKALVIDYEATTDKPTPVNLTHHSFFNLTGNPASDILGHELTIVADRFTPVDDGLIPTGELRAVKGTPFDFLQPHKIGERIGMEDEQLKRGKGYDHNWVLNKTDRSLTLAATVNEPVSGRVMEVWTTEPALQFYSGNFLDGKDIGRGGVAYQYRTGFCLEAQHYPDSPNHADFPNTILRPGETYRQRTVYKFLSK